MPSVIRHLLPSQLRSALLSLAVLAAAVASIHWSGVWTQPPPAVVPLSLTLDHSQPLTLHLKAGQTDKGDIVDVRQDGPESVRLTLPSAWRRTEVSGGQIADVESESPTLGTVRWTLPPGVTVRFAVARLPSGCVLQNPSGVPLELRLTTVDVESGEVLTSSRLLQDISTTLW